MRRIFHLAVLAIIAMWFAESSAGTAQVGRGIKPVVVTEKDAGKSVKVPVGGTLVVRLGSNPTTGYQWQEVQSGGIYLQPAGRPRYEAPVAAGLGAGGVQVFTYKAVRPGKVRLTFHYIRPWEQSPINIYAVTIFVT